MIKRLSVFLVVISLITGCASTISKTTQLAVGMTKAQVIEVMGKPDSTRATEEVEFLIYKLQPGTSLGAGAVCGMAGLLTIGLAYGAPECRGGKSEDHFVKLEAGKVSSFGRVGDFDSTKDPTLNVNIKTKK